MFCFLLRDQWIQRLLNEMRRETFFDLTPTNWPVAPVKGETNRLDVWRMRPGRAKRGGLLGPVVTGGDGR